jgi:hypothetical protein
MNRFAAMLAAAPLLAIAACGTPTQDDSAEDFASRIGTSGNSETPAPRGTVAPKVQETKPGAAPGPFVPGTQTDPDSACKANLVGEFIGKVADEPTRAALQKAAVGAREVRFIGYGQPGYLNPDPTNPRLNLMLDEQNVIRDARCG